MRYSNRVYNKLFTKILDSSIWLESDTTRLIWVTCLAAMNEDGFVQFAGPGNLAHRANVSLDACQVALARLEGPDINSSDQDHEGKRLERVPGGWIVLNAPKYRALATAETVRAQTRERVAKYRKRHASLNLTDASRKGNAKLTPSETETETETETEQQTKEQSVVDASRPPKEPADPHVKEFLTWFQEAYKERRAGAVYLVAWPKHSAIVKRLLKAVPLERLQTLARIMLNDNTDDPFIVDSDRGIEILAGKFNWLSERLAQWEKRGGRR